MKTYLILLGLLVAVDLYAQNNWQIINRSDTGCITIQFVTPQIGWMCGIRQPCTLYKSTDCGYTWICSIDWNPDIFSTHIAFYNERRGFVGASEWGAVTLNGETWTQFRQPTGIEVEDAVYLDSLYLVGISNHLLPEAGARREICRSTDGGWTWLVLYSDTSIYGLGPQPVLARNGTLLLSASEHEIWRSTDRGATWQAINISPLFWGTLAVADSGVFFQVRIGTESLTAGIDKSTDDGLTWTTVWTDTEHVGQYYGLMDIKFSDRLHGWVSGDDGLMLQTSDGGESWESYTMPESHFGVSSMSFLDSTHGWAIDPGVGGPTVVYRWGTADGVPSGWHQNPVPANLGISGVYPNPFNSATTISFSLPKASRVKVEVFDVTGRLVAVPQPEAAASIGNYQIQFDGSNLASGIYFARVEAGSFSQTRKMVLMK